MIAVDVSYMTYARWQRSLMGSDTMTAQLKFWEKHLAGIEPLLLPSDHPRPAIQASTHWVNTGI